MVRALGSRMGAGETFQWPQVNPNAVYRIYNVLRPELFYRGK
jgi:hypothetical protein